MADGAGERALHRARRCGVAVRAGLFADWLVERLVDGAVVASARGEAIDADTRGEHDVGAGRTALEFDVP